MSERAFSAIKFRDWKQASGAEFYPKRFEREQNARRKYLDTVNGFDSDGVDIRDLMAGRVDLNDPRVNGLWAESLGDQVRITVIATGFSDSNVNRQDELFAAQQSQSKAAASAEPQRTAPATSPAQAAPTRNVGGTELPNFGNDQFELPDFLKRGSF